MKKGIETMILTWQIYQSCKKGAEMANFKIENFISFLFKNWRELKKVK